MAHRLAATPFSAPPAWVSDAVFYHVFVERFCNGDKSNDPKGTPRWGGRPRHFNHFGGDLAGVRKKLGYLAELGVNALYLNPIFAADSNHKYNTRDYFRIDPNFGDHEEFLALLKACHRRGMRIILDGVFNHTGDKHPFFRDAMRRGPASPYWHWYRFHGYPVRQGRRPNYDCWWGHATLPKLRVADNPAVQDYLFAITEHWTRTGIDGWRLDVPQEIVSPEFWREWRRRVRAINPEAYLVGEIWEEGLDWLHGDPFDANMNYPLRLAVLAFFARRSLSVDEFDAGITGQLERLGPEAATAAFNLLASHDVPRLMTECQRDERCFREAMLFQMLMPGAPVIYYGEELGMKGGRDPDNRRCLPWSTVKGNSMRPYVQHLIALRRHHPALRGPHFQTLLRHNDFRLYAFWRRGGGERLLVVMNSGEEHRHGPLALHGGFAEGTELVDHLGGHRLRVHGGAVALDLPARSTWILGPAAP